MTCPIPLPDRYPAHLLIDYDEEIFCRHLIGHRRLTTVLATALVDDLHGWTGIDTSWIARLLDGEPLPFHPLTHTVVPGTPAAEGPPRWAVTRVAVNDIDAWLASGDSLAPVGPWTGARKMLALLLWGHGCGVTNHPTWRSSTRRRRALGELVDPLGRLGDVLVATNRPGLDRHEILASLVDAADAGAVADLGLDGGHITEQRLGQWIRHAAHAEPAPIELAKSQVIAARDPYAVLPRRRAGLARHLGGAFVSEFAHRLAAAQLQRTSHRLGLVRPGTPQGEAELEALEQVHRTIAALLREHPDAADASASLWPLTNVAVYRDGHRVGHPTGYPIIDTDGRPHPRVRAATRTPDGVVWLGGDEVHAPSVWVEYEGGATGLRTVEHLETALWASSRWSMTITLVIVAAPAAYRKVLDEITGLDLSGVVERYRTDWPGAAVHLRLMRARDLATECPLHGLASEWSLRAGR